MTDESITQSVQQNIGDKVLNGMTFPEACDAYIREEEAKPDPDLWTIRNVRKAKLAYLYPPDTVQIIT